MHQHAPYGGNGFLMVGHMTVDINPISMDSTPMDDLDISFVTVHSISNKRFSIPISVETRNTTENLYTLVDCGAEGLFINQSIPHKWRKD